MLPSSTAALIIVLLAIVPGFITTTVWARSRTWKGPGTDFRTTLQSIAISVIIQLVASPLTIWWIVPARRELANHAVHIAIWLGLTVLVLPLILGVGTARLSDWFQTPIRREEDLKWIRRLFKATVVASVVPTIWDWLLTDNTPNTSYLVLTLRDGSKIGGTFEEGASALTSPEFPGIFLRREWLVDEEGVFIMEVPGTRGVMVNGCDIMSVRVLSGGTDDKGQEAEPAEAEEAGPQQTEPPGGEGLDSRPGSSEPASTHADADPN